MHYPRSFMVLATLVLVATSCYSRYARKTMVSPSASVVRRTFAYSPSVSINYEVHGNGSRTLILLHGFGASLETWRDIQPLLQPYFTLYLVDLKGSGLSSKPEDASYSVEEQARIITAFMGSLDLSQATLVGHSYGGGVALMSYLHHHPLNQGIDSLVLIDAAAYPQDFPFFVSVMRNPFLRRVANLLPPRTRASYTLHRIIHNPDVITPERIERYARFLELPGANHALQHSAAQILPDDIDKFVSNLSGITLPTLILWGREDSVIPVRYGQRLHEDLSNSEIKVFPQCGHIPHEEFPDLTASAIHEFIQTVPTVPQEQ